MQDGDFILLIDFMPFLDDYKKQLSLSEMRNCYECLICVVVHKEGGMLKRASYNYFGGYEVVGGRRQRVTNDHWFVRASLDDLVGTHSSQSGLRRLHIWLDCGPSHIHDAANAWFRDNEIATFEPVD